MSCLTMSADGDVNNELFLDGYNDTAVRTLSFVNTYWQHKCDMVSHFDSSTKTTLCTFYHQHARYFVYAESYIFLTQDIFQYMLLHRTVTQSLSDQDTLRHLQLTRPMRRHEFEPEDR